MKYVVLHIISFGVLAISYRNISNWGKSLNLHVLCTRWNRVRSAHQINISMEKNTCNWNIKLQGCYWKMVASTETLIEFGAREYFFFFFLIVCFTSYFVFSIAVLRHSPGVVYYHLLLRRETRIPGVAPFSFRIVIWVLFVHRGQISYTPTDFGKLWATPGVRWMKHASS